MFGQGVADQMGSLEAWLPYILVPALVISVLAQVLVQYVFVRSGSIKTRMSGYAVARHVLDGAGKYDVQVEQVPGQLSDHFDTRRGILQLSGEVYHGRNVATMAMAAHEASHALQNVAGNKWLVIRELAIPAASFGSGGGILIAIIGLICRFPPLLALGIALFSASLYLQLLNLPIELHASWLARQRLIALGIVDQEQLPAVRLALVAAALTYVGATLQSMFTLFQRLVSLLNRPRGEP
jgi:Zn-dependent membrane protease YugP